MGDATEPAWTAARSAVVAFAVWEPEPDAEPAEWPGGLAAWVEWSGDWAPVEWPGGSAAWAEW
jgi:hypothetical protein